MAPAAKEALELVVASLHHNVVGGSEEGSHRIFFTRCLMLLEARVVTEPLVTVLALDLQTTVFTHLFALWGKTKVQDVGKVWRALLLS